MQQGDIAQLESFIQEKMIQTKLPGLSLVLLENAQVIQQRNFGFRNLQKRGAPTSETLFGLGSITKVFTALAIMQLRDKGLLSVGDPVSKYLGVRLESLGEPICIKHFLSHGSGIPALGYSESKMSETWWMDGYPISSVEDVLTFMNGAETWAQAKPGERWFYLNEGYILLGAIIERVSGKKYINYIHEHVLEPLGMKRSFFKREEVEREEDRATPYLQDRDGNLFVGSNLYSEIPAAGGLVSTPNDMTKFVQMFLQGGRTDTNEFISRESLELLQTPVVAMPMEDVELFSEQADIPRQNNFYGLGLQVQKDFFGHTVMGHGGGVMGGTTYFAYIPKRQIAVVLLANAHGYPMSQLALASLACLLGKDFRELSFVRLDDSLEHLVGKYASFRETILAEVKRKGDGLELILKFKHEDRIVTLFPVSFSNDTAYFQTFSGGRCLPIEFRLSNHIDLVYERYVFRKVGI
jgi:CubicO group peptidase (beta-lactamase class C family)